MTDRNYRSFYSAPSQSPSSRLAAGLLRRIKGAARKERWGSAIFRIAWTAGPVTYLGLQGGYYIAYGKPASSAVFIYFAGYTLIAGLFALSARFIYNATHGDRESADQEALEFVFDALPLRIVEIRNLQLKVLDPFGRKVMAAKYLLENPNAGSESFSTAIQDLLEDEELAALFRRMETYRGNGLYVRAEEIQQEISPLISSRLDRLKEVSGPLSESLSHRILDEGKTDLAGRKRIRGFLSRCYSAIDKDDLKRMSLSDAEEIFILLFEIINGRSFPSFRIEYRGEKSYTESARTLQKAKREYRAAIYKRNDTIRILAELLYKPVPGTSGLTGQLKKSSRKRGPGIHKVLASIPDIRSARIFQDRIIESMKVLLSGPDRHSTRAKNCMALYKRLHRQGKSAAKAYENFSKAWEKRESLLRSPRSGRKKLLKKGEKGTGVVLIPSLTSLDRNRILPFARKIKDKLEEFDAKHENSVMQANDEKELAIDLMLIADDYLPLEEIPVQQAIEGTVSAYVSRSGRKSAGAAETDWGLTLVKDNLHPEQQVLHEVLDNLLAFERLKLREDDIDYLAEMLGADRDFLFDKIKKTDVQEDFSPEPPYVVPSPDSLSAGENSRD
ncbi:hypothetical protein [Spirochaeta isovalerica]|uniref:TerB-C domain-containing protein n=1 Tax=Spirochaeta isovalerica TaxID=150 RepID=A0A841R9J0_9SPIO|nr:hypothetical protein [Spirochaeta isovalerica]MBB6480031.1 hypothetical protein [Spirochaeta isovalerica]